MQEQAVNSQEAKRLAGKGRKTPEGGEHCSRDGRHVELCEREAKCHSYTLAIHEWKGTRSGE